MFDGYDELKSEHKEEFKTAIKDSELTHYIITSRPYGYQRNEFEVDEHFETIGFIDENVEKYIKKFFDDTVQRQQLQAFLDSNIAIKQISYIPLMLEMICTLWQEKAQNNQTLTSPMTMTELYSSVIEYILNKYSANKNDESVYKRKNRKKIKEQLGKVAFEALKQQKILFDGDLVETVIDDIAFFEISVINSGFLKSDRSEKDILDNYFEFPHLTFQEYFSALYVSKLSQDEQREIIKEYKFYPHFQVFFAFLASLIEDKEFLLSEFENEPKEVTGFYTLILQINCLNQIIDETQYSEKVNYKIQKFVVNILGFNLNHEYFLESIRKIIPHINTETLEFFVEIILEEDEESLDDFDKENLIDIIYLCYKYNNTNIVFIDILLEKGNINSKNYINILLDDSTEKIIDELFELKLHPYQIFEILDNIDTVADDEVANKVRSIIKQAG